MCKTLECVKLEGEELPQRLTMSLITKCIGEAGNTVSAEERQERLRLHPVDINAHFHGSSRLNRR